MRSIYLSCTFSPAAERLALLLHQALCIDTSSSQHADMTQPERIHVYSTVFFPCQCILSYRDKCPFAVQVLT